MKEAAFYNGKVGEASEMCVPFLERTNFFGDAVYDVTYALDYGLFAVGEHVERLFAGARRVGIEPPLARCELIEQVRKVIRMCDTGDLMVYMQFSGGAGRREHVRRTNASVWIYCFPKKIEDPDKKYKLITAPDIRYGLCGVKTINLLPNVLAANAADSVGFVLTDGERRAAVVTDLGRVTEEVLSAVSGADLAVLECNYEPDWLRTGRAVLSTLSRAKRAAPRAPQRSGSGAVHRGAPSRSSRAFTTPRLRATPPVIM